MTTSLTLNNTDAKLESEEDLSWQDYDFYHSLSASYPVPFDNSYEVPGLPIVYSGKRTGGSCQSINTPPYTRQTSLVEPGESANFNSYRPVSCLKRPFSQIDLLPYGECASDVKEGIPDTPNPNISQDHQLLSFAKLPETHTLIDDQGQIQRINLTAQLHGMFFLSELAATPGELVKAKPELTCYRRNLFQISGSVITPREPLYCLSDRGEKMPLVSMEVKISATESVDGHNIKLIVIPWKTPPPNTPDTVINHDRDPQPIPITAYKVTSDAGRGTVCSPIAYRRLQFRIATANNGRRRELQQHFNLHLTVVGTLADGSQINVCETSTAPIVVRGRSPRNFQARKGIPLVGSSSSRGNPPELQMAMNLMASNALAENKTVQTVYKGAEQNLEVPRSEFTFDSNSIAGSPSISRIVPYPAWDTTHPLEHHSGSNNFPPSLTALDMYIQPQAGVMDLSPTVLSPSSVSSHSSRPAYASRQSYPHSINRNHQNLL